MAAKKNKKKVLVVGELNMDLIMTGMEKFPKLKTEIFSTGMTLTMGSSSAILASNLSVLGTGVSFTGLVGKDQFGEQIKSTLALRGVNTDHIAYSKNAKTGLTVALSYVNDRSMITYPGAMLELKEKDIKTAWLKENDHLHVSSVFMQPALKEGVVKLFKRAKRSGMTTSLDTQWDPAEKWDCDWEELLPLVDIFMPNEEEIKSITGKRGVKSAIEDLKPFANSIVVKRGIEGSTGWNGNVMHIQSAFLNKNVCDTIGAGDSFNAGFIHHFLQKKSLPECMEWGAICGAINTTAFGGTAAFENIKIIKETARKKFNYSFDDL